MLTSRELLELLVWSYIAYLARQSLVIIHSQLWILHLILSFLIFYI
jgi:hypothetical protein